MITFLKYCLISCISKELTVLYFQRRENIFVACSLMIFLLICEKKNIQNVAEPKVYSVLI